MAIRKPMATMKTDPKLIVTFDSLVDWMEAHGDLVPPFSPEEKALARAVALAWYFAQTFREELPERTGLLTTEGLAFFRGICRVRDRRDATRI